MIDINLLPTKTVLSATAQRWQRNLFLAVTSLGVLVVFAGGLVLVLGRLESSQAANLSAQRLEQLNQFNADTTKLTMLISLKDKIVGIQRVQAVRPNMSVAIAAQQGLSVDGVTTTRLIIGTDGSMSFDVTVRDTVALSAYLTKLESSAAKDFFNSLIISGLHLSGNGSFSFSVNGQFDKSKLLVSKSS